MGLAFAFKLAEEVHDWDDAEARQWSANLQPLADGLVARYLAFLPKQNYPIRSGMRILNDRAWPGLRIGLYGPQRTKFCGKASEERSRTYYGRGRRKRRRPGSRTASTSLAVADGGAT